MLWQEWEPEKYETEEEMEEENEVEEGEEEMEEKEEEMEEEEEEEDGWIDGEKSNSRGVFARWQMHLPKCCGRFWLAPRPRATSRYDRGFLFNSADMSSHARDFLKTWNSLTNAACRFSNNTTFLFSVVY